jgi:N-acetylglutamate synthase-like GNAT family acetyltransferase
LACYDNPEVAEMMSIAKRPAMEDPGNGKEFIEGILIIFQLSGSGSIN